MDDYKYKTPDQIKLRITEASTETATADPMPGAAAIAQPQTAEPAKAQAGLAWQHSTRPAAVAARVFRTGKSSHPFFLTSIHQTADLRLQPSCPPSLG